MAVIGIVDVPHPIPLPDPPLLERLAFPFFVELEQIGIGPARLHELLDTLTPHCQWKLPLLNSLSIFCVVGHIALFAYYFL